MVLILISLQSALYEAAYVTKQNNLSLEQVTKLIQANTKRHVFDVDTIKCFKFEYRYYEAY